MQLTGMHRTLRTFSAGLAHLLFPQLCAGCRRPLLAEERLLCLGCARHLPRTGYHTLPDNDTALRFAGRVPFERATSFAHFTDGGLLQHLLHRMKYGRRTDVAVALGRLFGQELHGAGWMQGIDAIIPVPLHPRKEAKRGYNQSERLAAGLSDATGVPVRSHALRRTRFTESQTQKTRAERLANVSGAFRVRGEAALHGKHVLLLDDVLTTGATMEACAAALLRVPGLRVSLATLALAAS